MLYTTETKYIPYDQAITQMQKNVTNIQNNTQQEYLWFLQHPPCYTAGISAKPEHLINNKLPVYNTKRGGQYTYHGPGQRIVYAMLNLKKRQNDVRLYVQKLQEWLIWSLAQVGVNAFCRQERIGLWVYRNNQKNSQGYEDKIAAIGIRIQKWITSHGVSININPNLNHFNGIIPCGINNPKWGVTSLNQLGITTTMEEFDDILKNGFSKTFT